MRIYHNPRCSKSRIALEYLKESGLTFEVIEYLKNIPTITELEDILDKLNISARELLRTSEQDYKLNNLALDTHSEAELLAFMVKYPKLIERPIIVKIKKACIARPLENLKRLLNE